MECIALVVSRVVGLVLVLSVVGAGGVAACGPSPCHVVLSHGQPLFTVDGTVFVVASVILPTSKLFCYRGVERFGYS